MFKVPSSGRGLAPVVLSRSLGDSATVNLRADSLEQLRRVHGGHAGVGDRRLCAFTFFNILSR